MGETYTELLVKRKVPLFAGIAKTILIVFMVLFLLLGMIGSFLFLLAAIALGLVYYFLLPKLYVEYEYLHMNDELDIDEIYSQRRRKKAITISLDTVVVLAPLGSHMLDSYEHLGVVDYSANDPNQKPYVMVCKAGNEMKQVFLQMNTKMLKSLKLKIGRRLIED